MNIFTPPTNFSKVSRILLSLFTLLIFQTGFALAQDAPFITIWKTDNPGSSEDNQITIPGTGTDYLIEWEEVGNEAANNGSETGTDEHTITFPSAGTYRVKISGDFTRIEFEYINYDGEKILDIEQWGDIKWSTMENAFLGCSNLNQTATDIPDLSNVTNMSRMFEGANSFNGDIGSWNVSNVTDMSSMFDSNFAFTGDISNWDVSNVTDMSWMFSGAYLFNGEIGKWNISKVTNMSYIFNGAESFNQNIKNWNVSNVIDMSGMFWGAILFNKEIGDWDVSNVTDMSSMFEGASSFNKEIGGWNVSNVTDMSSMFFGGASFNQDLNNWNVASVTDMRSMFKDASDFNQDISFWIVSNVTDMSGMFERAITFNKEIGGWDVSNVTDMNNMFYKATAFDQYLGNWDLTNVTSLVDFLSHSGLSITNYDLSLEGWIKDGNIPLNIKLSVEGLTFCASVVYRQQLIDDFGWDINGDEACSLTVEETYPAADATLVEKNTEIHITFDQEIQKIDFSSITLKDITGEEIPITGIYINGLKLYLTHNGLESSTYEVIVPDSSLISIANPATANQSISWSFTTQRVLSSKDKLTATDHSTYPNPFTKSTTLQFNLKKVQTLNVLVFDAKGKLVRKEQYDNLSAGKQSIIFERKELPAGLYQYQIQSKAGSVGGKMLIE